ncbi:MAG: PA14 domain-containing protein [Phycisphaerae bacterium]
MTCRLDRAGQVSAAVYDADGRLVRELLRGARRAAGTHTVAWDGLDRDGRPQPPGRYEVRILRTPGFTAHYVTSLGINSASGPADTWVGNHGGAASVARDAGGLYVAAQITETAPVLLKQSLDGRTRHWTRGRGDVTTGRYQGGIAMAADGHGRLYMLQQNGYLQVIDGDEGRRVATWDVLPEGKKRKSDGGPTYFIYRHGDEVAGADLAARGKTFVVSYREKGIVRWLSPEDGSALAEVKVSSPTGVAVGPKGRVYAISGERVVTVTREGKVRTVIERGLSAPRRLDVAAENGDLLIAERAPGRQVKRFAVDGTPKATYGRQGGRRDGRYDAGDFRDVTDIAADGEGGFVIAELHAAPRRVARFRPDGTLIDEWYGGQPYYAWGEPDPRNPSHVWFNAGHELVLAEIDYGAGTWRVRETYRIETLAGGLVRAMPGHAGRWRVLYHAGRRYLVATGTPQVLAHGDGMLRAVTVLGKREALSRAKELAGHEGKAGAFRWLDADGDGEPQPGEFTFSESPSLPGGTWVADDFAALRGADDTTDDGPRLFRIYRTAPTWADGRPVYPLGDEPGLDRAVATVPCEGGTGSRGRAVYRSRSGEYYAHYNTGDERHGDSWPTHWAGISRVVGWTAAGEPRFKVGRHAIHGGLGPAPHTTLPGRLHVPDGIIGEAGGTIVVADRVETLAGAWTTDGLYAGSFFDHRPDDGLPDTVYYWWRTPGGTEALTTSDNAAGGRVFQRDDGTVLWFVQGRNCVLVYTVTGWDDWDRQNAAVTLERLPARAKAEGTGLTAQYFPRTDVTGEAVAARVETRIWHGSPRGRPGNDSVVDGFRAGPVYDWSEGVEPVGKPTGFAVRWTGRVEPPLTEAFTFSVYARGGARLWVDGRQRVFGWNECTTRWESDAIPLEAGRRYPVQLDFFSTQPHPACSLNWESFSLDRRRVPTRYLYPDEGPAADEPDVRPAVRRIPAATFDAQSGDVEPGDVRDGTIRGLRQRAFGVSGAWLAYRRIDFGKGVQRLHVDADGRLAGRGEFPVRLAFRLDKPDGPTVAVVDVSRGDAPHAVDVKRGAGVHTVYVVNATEKHWHFIRFRGFKFDNGAADVGG